VTRCPPAVFLSTPTPLLHPSRARRCRPCGDAARVAKHVRSPLRALSNALPRCPRRWCARRRGRRRTDIRTPHPLALLASPPLFRAHTVRGTGRRFPATPAFHNAEDMRIRPAGDDPASRPRGDSSSHTFISISFLRLRVGSSPPSSASSARPFTGRSFAPSSACLLFCPCARTRREGLPPGASWLSGRRTPPPPSSPARAHALHFPLLRALLLRPSAPAPRAPPRCRGAHGLGGPGAGGSIPAEDS
jgi:hypothetical protein